MSCHFPLVSFRVPSICCCVLYIFVHFPIMAYLSVGCHQSKEIQRCSLGKLYFSSYPIRVLRILGDGMVVGWELGDDLGKGSLEDLGGLAGHIEADHDADSL